MLKYCKSHWITVRYMYYRKPPMYGAIFQLECVDTLLSLPQLRLPVFSVVGRNMPKKMPRYYAHLLATPLLSGGKKEVLLRA